MKRHVLLMALLVGMSSGSWAQESRSEDHFQHSHLVFGPLTVEVYYSKAANIFHVVDQLSSWSRFCHPQYRAYFEGADRKGLSDEDLRQLARHARIRSTHSWGQGLEQTFYRPLDIDGCIKAGVAEGLLPGEEAETERQVLTHFEPRIEQLMLTEQATIETFVSALRSHSSDVKSWARKFARFCACKELSIPLYLIANPHARHCGGGYNGGRMTLEVPSKYDIYPTFLHETLHAFLRTKQALLAGTASGVDGLDEETLNEGIAYAFNPGIVHPAVAGDPLVVSVAADLKTGKALNDPYVRFRRLGLALRPLLSESLDDPNGRLETFLPRARDAWRVVMALQAANELVSTPQGQTDSNRSIFIFGPAWESVEQRVRDMANNRFSCRHELTGYRKMLSGRAKRGDVVILLLSLDDDSRVPKEFEYLLPEPWPAVEAKLRTGESGFLAGEAQGMQVLMLASPTQQALETLVERTNWAAKITRNVASTQPVP